MKMRAQSTMSAYGPALPERGVASLSFDTSDRAPDPANTLEDASSPQSLAYATVDLAAIAHNTALVAKAAGGARLMAMVKADGFGHGAAQVARTALAHGASWLGVTSQTEAMALRHQGIDAPILMWLYGPSEDLSPAVAASVDVSVASTAHLGCIADAARRTRHAAAVHLKIDTGLGRSGALPADWPALVAAARRLEQAGVIRVVGIWSHLGNAEDPSDPHLAEQSRLFGEAFEASRAAGLAPQLRHMANSAALFQMPELHFDLVRAGIALYGVEPVARRRVGLRPAMTLQAQIILTKRVPAGTPVSYGHAYATRRETTLALVPVGFADGVPRVAWQRASVAIRGVRCPVAGRVAMDQFVVDAGDLPVEIGDTAILFGPGRDGEPTAEEWAAWADTNPHEILTRVGSRVARRYLPGPP
jgi:alanine racemase